MKLDFQEQRNPNFQQREILSFWGWAASPLRLTFSSAVATGARSAAAPGRSPSSPAAPGPAERGRGGAGPHRNRLHRPPAAPRSLRSQGRLGRRRRARCAEGAPPAPAALPRLSQPSPLRAQLSAGRMGTARRPGPDPPQDASPLPGRSPIAQGPAGLRCVGQVGPRPGPWEAAGPASGPRRHRSAGAPFARPLRSAAYPRAGFGREPPPGQRPPDRRCPRVPRPASPSRGDRAGLFPPRGIASRGSPGPGRSRPGGTRGRAPTPEGSGGRGDAGAEPSPRTGLPCSPGAPSAAGRR